MDISKNFIEVKKWSGKSIISQTCELPVVIVGRIQMKCSIAGLLDLPVFVVVFQINDVGNFPANFGHIFVLIFPPM